MTVPPPPPPSPYEDGAARRSQAATATPPAVTRIMPHDVDAEAAVLGGLFIDPVRIHEVAQLIPEDFYLPSHRVIYEALRYLSDHGRPIDLVMVRNTLESAGQLEMAGGLEVLLQLCEAVPSAANIAHYADLVSDRALARALVRTSTQIMESVFEEQRSEERRAHDRGRAAALLDDAEAAVLGLRRHRPDTANTGLRDILVHETFPLIDALHSGTFNEHGVATGFHELDDMLAGGFHPGELIVLAARPSMGKTSLAVNCALTVAEQRQKPVLIFSMEMSRCQIAMNMLCMDAGVSVTSMRKGMCSDGELAQLRDAAGRLSDLPIIIVDQPALTVNTLRAMARSLDHQRGGTSAIFVDYLQLMSGERIRRSDNRQQEIADISRGLKALARELNAPVIALSQLNRGPDAREGHRPRMSDLRESGAIEQDADVVLFLYRDEYYNPASDKRGLAEIIVGKQRNGPTGTVELQFRNAHMRFANLSYRDPLDL